MFINVYNKSYVLYVYLYIFKGEEALKKIFTKKRLTITLVIILLLISLTTIFVGNYFVNYALMPSNGAEEREPVADVLPSGVAAETETTTKIVAETKALEDQFVEEWLIETADLTEEVEITSYDGLKLRGHAFYQEEPSDDWVVVVHGYQVNEEYMYPVAHHYYKEGYNVLSYNQRSLGNSDGEYLTMGIKEKYDLVNWLEFLLAHHPKANIVTHGQSMGSGTVLMASGLEEFPDEVVAVISDSGYSSVWNVFESELYQRFELPSFPALHMAGIVAIPRVDINIFNEGITTEWVAQSNTPTLFIHGTADDFVPSPMVHELYDAHPTDEKEKFIVEGAGHSDSKFLEPELYYETVFSFIEQYKN